MEQKEIVLINNTPGRYAINFRGAFPNNKWTSKKGGKIYLSEREFEWLQTNCPGVLERKDLIVEGSEEELTVDTKLPEEKYEEFFAQHVNKAKAQASKIEDLDEVNQLLQYADENEINNKAVDALIARANELGE